MIRFPAEWEPQSAVLIAWPHATGDFSRRIDEVERSFQVIAKTISGFQRVLIVCRDVDHKRRIERMLNGAGNIEYLLAPVNDIWVRDTAFLTVENDGSPQLLNFRFNGWGEKYPYNDDNALNHRLASSRPFLGVPACDYDFILEGGSVESDGIGSIMTTRQCLLNPNRNRGMSRYDIERQLGVSLGATKIMWLDQPNLTGDDTDAHIDTLARFCAEDTIAYTACTDPDDPHYPSLKNMEAQLQAFRTRSGRPYHLVDLPMPKAIFDDEGQRLPANYANFLIINRAVLVPGYDDAMDAVAMDRLKFCFQDREIISVPCRPIVHQYGSLHCMTMQFPSGVVNLVD